MPDRRPHVDADLAPADSLFAALVQSSAKDWHAYINHAFVRRLGDGSLPEECFRHYLIQDYLFLLQFSRAYALAAYKSDNLADMRQAAATLTALLDTEIDLHVTYCAGWGLSETDMAAVEETPQNLAYTRFVLEAGNAGDLLDLLVALAPCVVGYAEIGNRLRAEPSADLAGNLYRDWIEMYAGAEYQSVARAAVAQLDRVAAHRIGASVTASPRWPSLVRTFRTATKLEADFWEMGLHPPVPI
jgi:thiaminase (transcriptional activator TenA)